MNEFCLDLWMSTWTSWTRFSLSVYVEATRLIFTDCFLFYSGSIELKWVQQLLKPDRLKRWFNWNGKTKLNADQI